MKFLSDPDFTGRKQLLFYQMKLNYIIRNVGFLDNDLRCLCNSILLYVPLLLILQEPCAHCCITDYPLCPGSKGDFNALFIRDDILYLKLLYIDHADWPSLYVFEGVP